MTVPRHCGCVGWLVSRSWDSWMRMSVSMVCPAPDRPRAGLTDKQIAAHPIVNVFDTLKWDELPEAERQESARKMEVCPSRIPLKGGIWLIDYVYAAMVSCMDTEIGKIVRHLEANGELDNTFILFASDNGAEGTL